jgi:DNA-directed RNA polymerase subunit RPC12/RpoP
MNTPQEFASLMAEKTDRQLQDMFALTEDWSPQALAAARAELQRRNLRPMAVKELLCPECLATLESRDGQTARCTTHGGEFQILFLRSPLPTPPRDLNTPPIALAAGAMCLQHVSVPASYACRDCGTPICGTCAFEESDGSHVCPSCAGRRLAFGPPRTTAAPSVAAGVCCLQHTHLQATAQCKTCGAFMCDTCKFEMPGGIQICPSCATTPRTTLSPKRKKMLIGSYALAGWCTLVMGALFAGVFQGMVKDKASQQAFGLLLMFILLGPSIVGVSLGVGVMDRRLPNTITMWIATAWNGLILGGFILLMIVGMMKGE